MIVLSLRQCNVDVQASPIEAFTHKLTKPTKHMQQHARELLSRALLKTNTPPTILSCPEFQKYVSVISRENYAAPSRYLHLQTVMDLASRCHNSVKNILTSSVCFSIEQDSWTGDGRKFSAVTAGMPSQQLKPSHHFNIHTKSVTSMQVDLVNGCLLVAVKAQMAWRQQR
jgi:hypothetical protein